MDQDTGMVFHAVFRAHQNAVHASLVREGLGWMTSPRLLFALVDCKTRGEHPSQRELADLLHISPATIAASLKALERNGYVVRDLDPSDLRRNRVAVTDKAVDALERGGHILRAVDQAMLSGFTDEEVEALHGYLLRMRENLYAIGGDMDAPCAPQP